MAKQATKMKKKAVAKPAPIAAANPTPNEAASMKAAAQDGSSWWDTLLGVLPTFGIKGSRAKSKGTQKVPAKNEKKAAGSQYNASQLQMFAENKIIPDEDYETKLQEYVNKQAKLSGKPMTDKERTKLESSFRNTYKRASDFYSGLSTDQSGFATMDKLKEFSELTGIPIDPNLTDQENLYKVNKYINQMKASGMDPFKERNSWDDPRAVSKFLQTAANSLGSFTTPEQLVFSGKGGNKTYSRHSTAQLMPVSGITGNK